MTEDSENKSGQRPEGTNIRPDSDVSVHETEGTELERNLGLTGGLAVGVGTMIGAGIFVFPGLAAGEAGPAAAASFAIGMIIALLVALPASELATAMPRSGGGYYFISRGLGSLAGALVGISLFFGLMFASAFYLVGFGNYFGALLAELGFIGEGTAASFGVVAPLAIVFGLGLIVLNIGGTDNVARLQNSVVGILIVILTLFLGYGGLSALGVVGQPTAPEQFAPFGLGPIFTTAALVFTSYLGFAQVATVAGEIKNPSRNLPLAMVGSVIIVGIMYVVTIFVATSARGSVQLAMDGETAMAEVAGQLFGPIGVAVILFAGLLATVSSANASILSTSRTVYALSRDALLPRWAGRVNVRYGTPHIALMLGGGVTLFLVILGRVEVLAEVASFLHLLMYGLMCVTLIVLRRRDPDWYDPSFTVPGHPFTTGVGGLASFALILFMEPLSQLIGIFVIVVSGVWYWYYARNVELKDKL